MSHIIYAANGKSVTFTGICANEIKPSINRSFVYKAKEERYVRILFKLSFHSNIKLYAKPRYQSLVKQQFSLFERHYN